MVGKTAVSRLIAAKLNYSCIPLDDIGGAVNAICGKYEKINPMEGYYFQNYYLEFSVKKLIAHSKKRLHFLKPAYISVIKSHCNTWSTPAVIEGCGLFPELVSKLDSINIGSVWMVTNENLLKKRLRNDESFLAGCSDKEKLINQYTGRSMWYNREIEEQAKKYKMKTIRITGKQSIAQLTRQILILLKQGNT